jgi:hypothetical protein
MNIVTHTAAYMRTGTNVEKSVAKESELVPVVTFNADVEVALSLELPTLGSLGCRLDVSISF